VFIPEALVNDARGWLADSRELMKAQLQVARENLNAAKLLLAAIPMLLTKLATDLCCGQGGPLEEEAEGVLAASPLAPFFQPTPNPGHDVAQPPGAQLRAPLDPPAWPPAPQTREELKRAKYPDRTTEASAGGVASTPPDPDIHDE
jgi:hypothetical protein